MPKKAVDYVIQRQEQFEQDIQKRNLPDYQKKRLIVVTHLSIYTHVHTVCIYPKLIS